MKLKLIALTAIILLSSGLATAEITFNHEENIVFQTPTEFNDNVDLNNANLLGFPTRNCPDGQAVTDVNQDGTVQCSEIGGAGGEAQNLSEVLNEGNSAEGQNIENLARLNYETGTGIVLGDSNTFTGQNTAVAIGNSANASDEGVIAIGDSATTSGLFATALGGSTSAQVQGTALGYSATAGTHGTALGENTEAGYRGTTVGRESIANSAGSGALGFRAEALENDAVAIGRGSVASGDSSMAIGQGSGSTGMGEGDIAFGADSLAEGGATGASTAIGKGAEASGDATFAFGDEANATGEMAGAIGGGSMAHGYRSTGIGTLSNATSQYTTTVGVFSWARDDAGLAVGYNSQTHDMFGTSLGTDALAEGYSATSVGGEAVAEGDRSVAVGSISEAANRGVAVGSESNASTQYSVSLGQLSSVTGEQAGGMALGRNARAQGSGVAIGEDAFSDENRTVVFGGGIYDYDIDVTGNLGVDGVIDNKGVRDIGYSTGHTAWEDGLDREEVNRFGAASNEVTVIERLDVQLKGGGAETDFTVTLSDTAGNPIAQADAGGVQNNVGETAQGEGLIVEVTNTVGEPVEASISLSGEVYDSSDVSTAD